MGPDKDEVKETARFVKTFDKWSYLIYILDQSGADQTSCLKFGLTDWTVTSTVAHVQCT